MARGLFRIKVTGREKLLRNLKLLESTYPRALNAAMYKEGVDMATAVFPRIPVDTKRLRESLGVTKPRKNRRHETRAYVGVDTPYAIVQHERTDFNHPRGGQAKYLEVVYRRRKSGYFTRLARLAGRYIANGTTVNQIDSPFPTVIRDPLGE